MESGFEKRPINKINRLQGNKRNVGYIELIFTFYPIAIWYRL